ncbi:GSCOCG00012617001-RA-CDS, partial [Cotesia congregata]
FYLPREDLGSTNEILHRIITTDDNPVFKKQYRFPPIHREEISRQVKELEEKGIIRPSESGYCSPIWIVKKKDDSLGNKRWRMVIDFRDLNEKTYTVVYPTPNIIEIIDQTGGAKYFSTFDLASGFHQIKIHPDDIHKTAFSTPYQHYEFVRMPFGLKNAPPTFQRLMNKVLMGMMGRGVFVYMDDIIVYSVTFDEHIAKIEELFDRLRQAGLQLQPDKCHLFRKEINYLGHIISANGVQPDPKKTDAVAKFPTPNNLKKVREFLGLTGYYRRFIDNYAKTSKPLTSLLQKDAVFEWGNNQIEAFETLKNKLITSPILQFPDFSREFIITTDACDYGIGACLSQGEINKDKPVSFASRLLTSAERNYSTIEKEMLAIVYAVNKFRPYIYGSQFILVTDHRPLTWVNSVTSPNSRIVRWRLSMEDYTYKVLYKPGRINSNVDSLSRNPVDEPEDVVKVAPIRRNNPDEIVSTPDETSEEEPMANKKRVRKRYNLRSKTRALNDTPEQSSNSDVEMHNESTDTASEVTENIANETNNKNAGAVGEKEKKKMPKSIEVPGPPNINSSSIEDSENEGLSDDPPPVNERHGISNSDAASATITPQIREITPNVCETRDRLSMQSDNILIFVNVQGKSYDEGSRELADVLQIPNNLNNAYCRSVVIPYKGDKRCIVAVPKYRKMDLVSTGDIRETLGNVYNNVLELGLESFSVAKTSKIDDVKWLTIQQKLIDIFSNTAVKITICLNLVRIPNNEERPQILEEYHGSAVGGHKGMTKTYKRIRQNFFWPKLKSDVVNYIQRCLDCQLKKLVRVKTKQPMVLTDTPDAGFDKIGLDIMYPTHISASGNRYILTIQDLLTKFSMAVALEHATAVDVAKALVNRWFCYFGPPKAILTDQGTNFLSSLLKNIAKKYKIKQYHTTAYNPQSNGSVERSHHVLQEYIKQCIGEQGDWDECLDLASFSYNVSEHEGTGFTPYQLVFGKLPRLPSQFQGVEETNESYAEYLEQLFRRIKQSEAAAGENLRRAKVRSKLYYDRKVNPLRIRPGTRVFLLVEPRKGKGDPQYTGPHEVLGIEGNEVAEIEVNGESKIIILLVILPLSQALMGFDCGGSSMNTSTLSLLDVGECKIPDNPPEVEKLNIYLLQPAEVSNVHVIECKILINRHIQHCGMHSHTSSVLYGRREYYISLDYHKCKKMHETNSVWLFDRIQFDNLKVNSTNHRVAILAGSQNMGGDCKSGTYSDEYGTWSGVVVDATFEITLTEYETALNSKTNEVLLRSGTRCEAGKLNCITSDGMSAFWSEVPKNSCLMKYAQLYQGPATRLIGENGLPDVYSLTTEDITFALAQQGTMEVCGHTVIRTEHPKLFIIIIKNPGHTLGVELIKIEDMDIFAYINSKFVYVEKFVRQQMQNLYHDVLVHRCELERAVLLNALALSSLTPDEFGYALMKGPGYYTTVAGELVHITKCVAVPVRVREAEHCYQELPVTYNNKSYFLKPKSRILVLRGTLVECNTILPIGYF